MKIQTYTPTEAMVVAVQWPDDPTGKDFNDLKHWVGDDLELKIAGSTIVTSIDGAPATLWRNGYLVRNDDQYTIYSQQEFENKFMEVG